jgi:hypothetical protein
MADREPTARDMAIAMMMDDIARDPQYRGPLHDILAAKYPEQAGNIPEVAARQAIAPEIAELRKEREALQAERVKDQQTRNRVNFRQALLSHGAKEDELDELEKYAVAHATADPKLVVMGFRNEHAVAAPALSSSYSPIWPTSPNAGEYFKGIGEDRIGWQRGKIDEIVNAWKTGKTLEPAW